MSSLSGIPLFPLFLLLRRYGAGWLAVGLPFFFPPLARYCFFAMALYPFRWFSMTAFLRSFCFCLRCFVFTARAKCTFLRFPREWNVKDGRHVQFWKNVKGEVASQRTCGWAIAITNRQHLTIWPNGPMGRAKRSKSSSFAVVKMNRPIIEYTTLNLFMSAHLAALVAALRSPLERGRHEGSGVQCQCRVKRMGRCCTCRDRGMPAK